MGKWLLSEASRLEAELKAALNRLEVLQLLVNDQAEELDRAWGTVNEIRVRLRAPEAMLKGRKIAVIGPSFREESYRRIVEQYGGRFTFAPSEEKLCQIDRVVSKAHGVIFIATYTSHAASDKVRAAAERYGKPLVMVHQTGLDHLEDVLLGLLAPQLCLCA
jgi:hypothetical protein